MAIVGHWTDLDAAKKLSPTALQQGIVETVIQEGQIIPMMPIKQLNSKELTYNRENSWNAEDGASFLDIHEQLPWEADEDTTEKTVQLKRIGRQDQLDKFIAATYNDVNDYRAVMITQLVKKVTRFAEHMAIYGDLTYSSGNKEFDGMHAWSADSGAPTLASAITGAETNIDNNEAVLALSTLRALLDAVKVDQKGRENVIILIPKIIARRFDAGYQEAGFVRSSVTIDPMTINIGAAQIGGRVMMFDGIPMIRSDFLQAEQLGTGTGSTSDKRALNSSGDKQYSIFVIRFAPNEEGGVNLLFGDAGAVSGQFAPFARTSFPQLENYDAGGERMVSYLAPILGANYCLGRIFDIEDGALTP